MQNQKWKRDVEEHDESGDPAAGYAEEQNERGENPAAGCAEDPGVSVTADESIFFPEELVEIILARIPFPYVFKVQHLSNSWNREFSGSWEGSPCKRLTPFQKVANSMSHNWPSYCPIFLTTTGARGFDRMSSQWTSVFPTCQASIPNYHSIPYDLVPPSLSGSWKLASFLRTTNGLEHVSLITNVITGRSTVLHVQRGTLEKLPVVARLLPGDSNSSYRVLHTYRDWNATLDRHELLTVLYDSKVRGWSNSTITIDLPDFVGADHYHTLYNNVFVQGKLYCLSGGAYLDTDMLLCVNHVDSDKTWSATGLSFSHDIFPSLIHCGGILLIGEKVMVVIYTNRHEIFIYELDLKVLGLSKLLVDRHSVFPEFSWSRPKDDILSNPPRDHKRNSLEDRLENRLGEPPARHRLRLASDDIFIYISDQIRENPVMTYNVHNGEWSTLPLDYCEKRSWKEEQQTVMLGSVFTPGLNPFECP